MAWGMLRTVGGMVLVWYISYHWILCGASLFWGRWEMPH